jgi:hypothetical protein
MEVVDPAMTVKALGHQWYWSTLCDILELHSDNVNLLSTSAVIVQTTNESITSARPLLGSDIPTEPSNNHNETRAVLDKALQMKSISSTVCNFIE